MRTKFLKLFRFSLIISLLIIPAISSFAINKTGYKTVSGIVYDIQSKKGVSSATLSVKNTNTSTVTNADGFFILKINDSINASQIEVSHLGYQNQLINFSDDNSENIRIFLAPNIKELGEVVIEAKDPFEIVKEAISKIATNNSNQSNILRGFYRETAQKRNSYITVSEAIIDMYKSPYTRDISQDDIQVLKGRTLLSPKLSDTIVVKAQGGPNIAKHLDIVKNKEIMLDPETIHFYKFKIDGFTTIEGATHYIISFQPQVIIPYALYYGKLYINKENLTFSRAELHLDTDDKDKASQIVLVKKPSKMRFQVNSLTSIITYKQQGDKSYLNYISNEIKFKCNWKRLFYIFAPTYTITSEIVVTDRLEDNVKKIPNKYIFRENQTLSDKIENFYDPEFWQAYNIIEPTESLESAVNKLKKSLK